MFCKNCGSSIDDKAVVCPKCGVPVGEGYVKKATDKSNPIAIVGFILSFFIALAGLICSIIGYNKAKNENRDYGGLALAGIIISLISIFLVIIIYAVSCNALLSMADYYSLIQIF
ncbi:zinc-ribbon domain-containing protein [Pumilibacter intestinalis]|uniref:zinc-ribbon domain-containing protein n=1 Tax=Pumilibacter intestinalis TaxID=2941511 RepID=UPI002040FE1D|nr:zinc-ribbon domain-containing protein [Pumilibacter intestinalis]